MKNLKKMLSFGLAYKRQFILSVVSSLLSVMFSVFSFLLLVPILEELFQTPTLDATKPILELDVRSVVEYFNYLTTSIVLSFGVTDVYEGARYKLIVICSFMSVVYFFKNLLRYLSKYWMAFVRGSIVRDMQRTIFTKVLSLDIGFYSNERKGDILSKVTNDVIEVEKSVLSVIEAYIKEPLTIIISFAMLLNISSRLTLFVIILFLFVGLVIGRIGKVLKSKSKNAQNLLGDITSHIDESIFGLRIIKAFTGEGFAMDKLKQLDAKYLNNILSINRRRDLSSPLTEFLGISVVGVLLWYGGNMVINGLVDPQVEPNIEPQYFFAFIGLFYNIIAPAKSFSSAFYRIRQGEGALERITDFLDAPSNIKEAVSPKLLPTFSQSIEYKNVQFGYNSDMPVIKDFSLEIKKGQTVALVGSSGAGKSTLADLLPRFYDVNNGLISIDGNNIKDIALQDLRSLMSVVSQEAILFNDTVYNNIVFGREGVTKEDVIRAAKMANADEYIVNLENGYDTIIGDRGMKLSGGQRQRLTIARAVLADPEILILDEATSALDSESERLVQEALINLMKDRTSLVVAHRLSTIQHADKIVVMDQGLIKEIGTHQELIAQEGIYSKLVKLQSV